MENAIVSLICITLILVGTVMMTMSSFSSLDMVSNSWKQMENQAHEINQTDIKGIDSSVSDGYGGSRVEITIRNEGGVSLGDFGHWDVIIQYEEGIVEWLSYNSGWTLGGIFFESRAEVFEPNILNPGEEMLLILNLDPPVTQGTINRATISTPNGVTTGVMFQWEVT